MSTKEAQAKPPPPADADADADKPITRLLKPYAPYIRPLRPLILGQFANYIMTHVLNYFDIHLDTIARMFVLFALYLVGNELVVRFLPYWITGEGVDPEFFKKPIAWVEGLELVKGEQVKIGGVTEEGRKRITVVEFFATWCGPCKTLIPNLATLQKKYASKDVNIVSISFEDKRETVQAFVETEGTGMDYTVYWDSKKNAKTILFDAANSKGFPFAVILDHDNKVLWTGNPHNKVKFEEELQKAAANATDRNPSDVKKAAAVASDGKIKIQGGPVCEGDFCTI
ncbi:hypothetical protein HDU97_001928 [Phlyctochytrium planicorne]|nr:hypothetical protein HDU97_001928 [Phlyctochytrium planicorne]